jgi:predicted metal-dependent phosphoesterase TrpH
LKRIDLHSHSCFSDGTSAPREVVARAAKAGVELLFLTDHDSIAGFAEARAAADGGPVKVHCGIEINTRQGDRVHILGYSLKWDEAALEARLSEFRERRRARVQRMVEALRAHGVDLSFEEIRGASRESLGRPHVADAMVRKGVVRNRQEAFARFLTRGKPGFVESMGPTPEEALELIKDAGGFSSLAHPQTAGPLTDLAAWKARGLEAIEVYYGAHTPAEVKRYGDIARHHGLLATGGSDYHGPGTGRDDRMGVDVPDEVAARFMERLARCS